MSFRMILKLLRVLESEKKLCSLCMESMRTLVSNIMEPFPLRLLLFPKTKAVLTSEVEGLPRNQIMQRVIVEGGYVGGLPDLVQQTVLQLTFDGVLMHFVQVHK